MGKEISQEIAYELLEACKKAQFVYDYTINLTPTGVKREKLTEQNILRMQTISKAEGE